MYMLYTGSPPFAAHETSRFPIAYPEECRAPAGQYEEPVERPAAPWNPEVAVEPEVEAEWPEDRPEVAVRPPPA